MQQPGAYQQGFAPAYQPGFASVLQPGMIPPGFDKTAPDRRAWEGFSYLDDVARCHGWILNQLARVFHERNKALKVCIPSSCFAVFLVILSTIYVMDVTSAGVDGATLRNCKVLFTRTEKVGGGGGGAVSPKYRPYVDVSVLQTRDKWAATRFRDPGDYEVDVKDASQYLMGFCVGCTVPCYQFEDGAVQLDESDYVSAWSYIIMAILLMSSLVCCCMWLASGTFACCSPLITVTLQV